MTKCLWVSIAALTMIGCNYLADPGAMFSGPDSIFAPSEAGSPTERGGSSGGFITITGSGDQVQGGTESAGYVLMIQGTETAHYTTASGMTIGVMIQGNPGLVTVLTSTDGKLTEAIAGTSNNGGNYYTSPTFVNGHLNGSDQNASMTFVKGTPGVYKMLAQGVDTTSTTSRVVFNQTFDVTVTN